LKSGGVCNVHLRRDDPTHASAIQYGYTAFPGEIIVSLGIVHDKSLTEESDAIYFPIAQRILTPSTRYWITIQDDAVDTEANVTVGEWARLDATTPMLGVAGEYMFNWSGVNLNTQPLFQPQGSYQMRISGEWTTP
jgi:hypothetical protein